MTDYKTMYLKLFNKVTDVIDELQEAQRQTEEMFLSCEVSEIKQANEQPQKNNAVDLNPQRSIRRKN